MKNNLRVSHSDEIIADQCRSRQDALSLWNHCINLAMQDVGNTACRSEWWFTERLIPQTVRYAERLGGHPEFYCGFWYILGKRIFQNRGQWATDNYRP